MKKIGKLSLEKFPNKIFQVGNRARTCQLFKIFRKCFKNVKIQLIQFSEIRHKKISLTYTEYPWVFVTLSLCSQKNF